MFISITWAKNWLYVPMSFNRDFKSLEYYLNKNNNDVTQTNDKDEFYEETKKVMERESVESFDVHSKPILGISIECKESEPKQTISP